MDKIGQSVLESSSQMKEYINQKKNIKKDVSDMDEYEKVNHMQDWSICASNYKDFLRD